MNVEPIRRSPSDWIEAPALRVLLKQNLGLNARKVTVSARSSTQYLNVVIRDSAVDVKAVKAFCASHSTWSMDQTDYCSGQSIRVVITDEVIKAHAAPFMAEAAEIALKLDQPGQWMRASNGASVSFDGRELTAERDYKRYYGGSRSRALENPDQLARAISQA